MVQQWYNTTPLTETLFNTNALITLSAPVVTSNQATYTVTVDIPVDFSTIVLNNPVDVSVFLAGTVRYQGQFVRTLPDWDDDGLHDSIDPDDDNDRSPDIAETIANTDPFSHLSFLGLRVARTGDPVIHDLSFPSSTGRIYRIQSSPDLLTGLWSDVQTGIVGTGGWQTVPDTNSAGRLYYRVGVESP